MNDDPVYAAVIREIAQLLADAQYGAGAEANAVALATAGADAQPSVRMVSVARIAPTGVVFFASAESGKGRQMRANPRAAMCLHWPALRRQVVIEGAVATLPDAEADRLWARLPREYGLSHWASDQGEVAADTATLRGGLRALKQRFDGGRVPRPPGWLAYEVRPDRIVIWHSGWQRLHPHRRYVKDGEGRWTLSRRNP